MTPKERINYIEDESGKFVFKSVNYNFICQADSLEDGKKKLSIMLKSWIKMAQDISNQSEPFEFIELPLTEFIKP